MKLFVFLFFCFLFLFIFCLFCCFVYLFVCFYFSFFSSIFHSFFADQGVRLQSRYGNFCVFCACLFRLLFDSLLAVLYNSLLLCSVEKFNGLLRPACPCVLFVFLFVCLFFF